jgi:iron(III) transport system ATP-binding protein
VVLDDLNYKVRDGGLQKGPAKMVLRPHNLHLAAPDQAGIKGEVSYAAYLGKEIQYTVESAIGSLFVISGVTDKPFAQGDSVSIQFDADLARLVAA